MPIDIEEIYGYATQYSVAMFQLLCWRNMDAHG